jgi:hypothetical protein
MVLIISYTLYKIRNQAKVKNLGHFDRSVGKKIGHGVQSGNVSIDLEETDKHNSTSEKEKNSRFTVINEEQRANQIKTLRFSYPLNIYKFYEELNSKIMFKIKPGVNAD